MTRLELEAARIEPTDVFRGGEELAFPHLKRFLGFVALAELGKISQERVVIDLIIFSQLSGEPLLHIVDDFRRAVFLIVLKFKKDDSDEY